MEMAKSGDQQAYETLVVKYRKTGIAFAYQIIQDEYLAEDIVQDCFVNLYISRDRYQNSYQFKTYLFTMIKNRSIDYIRKQKRIKSLENIPFISSKQSVEQMIMEREDMQEICKKLNCMKGDYKQMLYLYAVEDLSYIQIAKVMKQTTAQVKIKIYRARQKLRQLRMEEGGL